MPFEDIDLDTHALVVVSSGESGTCPARVEDLRVLADRVEVDLGSVDQQPGQGSAARARAQEPGQCGTSTPNLASSTARGSVTSSSLR